jgi:hypothetical protein
MTAQSENMPLATTAPSMKKQTSLGWFAILKKIFRYFMPRAKRRAFKIVHFPLTFTLTAV